eukprot:2257558-Prymnesium_polylepis.1
MPEAAEEASTRIAGPPVEQQCNVGLEVGAARCQQRRTSRSVGWVDARRRARRAEAIVEALGWERKR